MREIKFRAWASGEMDYEPWLDEYKGGGAPINSGLANFTGEIMQFTGLKDKKGKEIYEGDILRWYESDDNGWKESTVNKLVKVEWQQGFCRWGFRDFEFDMPFELATRTTSDGKALNYEVIGNTYETPELLS